MATLIIAILSFIFGILFTLLFQMAYGSYLVTKRLEDLKKDFDEDDYMFSSQYNNSVKDFSEEDKNFAKGVYKRAANNSTEIFEY